MSRVQLRLLYCASLVVALVCVWLLDRVNIWYGAFVIGFIYGIAYTRARHSMAAAMLVSVFSCALSFLIQATHLPMLKTASSIAGIVGLSASLGLVLIAVTLLLAFLQGVLGAWAGHALRSLFRMKKSAVLD